jgi:hypothetical protein
MVMFAEVRENGEWHKIGKEFISTYEELDGQLTDRVFDGRNAHLLSFLSENSIPGFPHDVSSEIKNHIVFRHYCSMHNITLGEILSLDWYKETCQLGYISEWQYERLKRDGVAPVNILKSASNKNVVPPFMMDMIVANQSLRQSTRYFVEYKYDKHTMRDLCDFFCDVSIPKLIKLIPEGGTTDDVRVIFSF